MNISSKGISIDVEKSNFHIYDYLRLYLTYLSIVASDDYQPDRYKQLEMLVEARSAIVHLTEEIKRTINKNYEFSGYLSQIDALIKMSEAELNAELLMSQLKANEISKTTNVFIATFTIVGGLSYLYDFIDKILPDEDFYIGDWTISKKLLSILLTIILVCLAIYMADIWLKRKEKKSLK